MGLCHLCGMETAGNSASVTGNPPWSFPRVIDSLHGNWASNFTKEHFPVDSFSLYAISSVNDCFVAKTYLFGCIVCTIFLCT